ncbi:MAG: hypothetical protein N2035_10405 [Chthoniobacterales bacterium]|nr:hypothetical protein [Chthoniobacterales bacterium]
MKTRPELIYESHECLKRPRPCSLAIETWETWLGVSQTVLLGNFGKFFVKFSAYSPRSELRPLGGLAERITISVDIEEEDPQSNALSPMTVL